MTARDAASTRADPRSAGRTVSSRETGLAVGLVVGRYLLGMRDLHYGYWPDGLEVRIQNLPAAQRAYAEELFAEIPGDVETILDVGCGAGNMARLLVERGYRVDCVSPPGPLADLARERLAGTTRLFETPFQELELAATGRAEGYDLVLFSESLLFIRPLELALRRAVEMARPGGWVLVSDIFRDPPADEMPDRVGEYHRGPIGGGYYLEELAAAVEPLPLEPVRETDVTARVAPTFAVLEQTERALEPAWRIVVDHLERRRPWLMKIVRKLGWIERFERKNFSGRRNAENFLRYKAYRRFLYRRSDLAADEGSAAE